MFNGLEMDVSLSRSAFPEQSLNDRCCKCIQEMNLGWRMWRNVHTFSDYLCVSCADDTVVQLLYLSSKTIFNFQWWGPCACVYVLIVVCFTGMGHKCFSHIVLVSVVVFIQSFTFKSCCSFTSCNLEADDEMFHFFFLFLCLSHVLFPVTHFLKFGCDHWLLCTPTSIYLPFCVCFVFGVNVCVHQWSSVHWVELSGLSSGVI